MSRAVKAATLAWISWQLASRVMVSTSGCWKSRTSTRRILDEFAWLTLDRKLWIVGWLFWSEKVRFSDRLNSFMFEGGYWCCTATRHNATSPGESWFKSNWDVDFPSKNDLNTIRNLAELLLHLGVVNKFFSHSVIKVPKLFFFESNVANLTGALKPFKEIRMQGNIAPAF